MSMIDDLVDELMSIMNELNVFSYNDDVIDSIMRNQEIEADESFDEFINETTEKLDKVERLITVFNQIRENENQDLLWDSISAQGKSPAALQALCYGLMKKPGKPKQIGVILYVTLLGLQPLNLLWNPMIFNSILSIMITASQAVEGTKALESEDEYCLHLTGKVLRALSLALNDSFIKLAGLDVVIALIELSNKMCTIYQKELEKYSTKLSQAAFMFLDAAAETNIDYILPFIVLGLILDFLPPGKTISNKIMSIRKNLLDFCKKHLSSTPEKTILVIKHIFIRSSERAAIRESTAIVVHELLKTLDDKDPIFSFLFKASKSQKAAHRTLALDLFRLAVNDEDNILTEEIELKMVECLRDGINDSVPNVRSASLNAINSFIQKADDYILESIGLYNDSFLEMLKHRICDEKLIVRKACLRLIHAVAFKTQEPEFSFFPLIADRTRDRSASMRQEAANILSQCLTKSNFPDDLIVIWFESILPLALDTDVKTQELALKLIDSLFFDVINSDIGIKMALCLNENFKEVLMKVFNVFSQKKNFESNLQSFCKLLQKMLNPQCEPILWKIADIVIGIVPKYFKKNYNNLWDVRSDLPDEYLTIIAKLNLATENIIMDSVDFLRKIVNDEMDITEATFLRIHSYVQILFSKKDDNEYDIISIAKEMLSQLADKVNNIVSNQFVTQQNLYHLVPSIFLLGELVPILKKTIKDYNFAGLQLLIGENLPNNLAIPSRVRSAATISIGKICLKRRDITNSFVAAFAHILHHSKDPAVKCNSLIVLCDLCVKFTATVDSYVMDMTACFADQSCIVRRQALLIMTRLIAEDYFKMRPLIFFRYIYSIVDPDKEVAKFAQNCLFNILSEKDPKFLSLHFIDAIFYFNNHIENIAIQEDREAYNTFCIKNKKKRRNAYKLLISKMNNATLFELLQASCIKSLQLFLDGTLDIEEGESLLSDTFEIMIMIEDEMEAVNINEANIDDPKREDIAKQSRILVAMVHDQLIKKVLPILNQMHRFLRDIKSPLQSNLRKFFRKLVQKHPSLLDDLQRQEPILAAELQHDISLTQTPDITLSQPSSPIHKTPFRSPLLSRIAKTPNLTMVAPSGPHSPLSFFSQQENSQSDNAEDPRQKQPPVPFRLEE